MLKNYAFKASVFTAFNLFSFAALAADEPYQIDMSDPTAIYSNATIGGGSEGVDITGAYGGYLGGVYKHRFDVAVKNDLEYYEANYLLLNTATESGLAIDTTWDRDFRFEGVNYKNANDIALGFFAKLGFMEKRLNFYPKVSVGYLWGDDFKDTTFLTLDATTRYSFNQMFWVGVTPTYTHGMKGLDLNEWETSVDAGAQFSDSFGVSVGFNNDKDVFGKVIFAF